LYRHTLLMIPKKFKLALLEIWTRRDSNLKSKWEVLITAVFNAGGGI